MDSERAIRSALLTILSPLIALPVLIISPSPSMLSLAFGCVLGVPHYLSTLTFYFWDDTRVQHRSHWMLFFGGPVLIVASIAGAILFSVPFIVQLVVYVWNTVHVARQSCGILSIYRHRAGVKDPAIKPIVNGAILWTAVALAFWDTSGYPTLHQFMTKLWAQLPYAVWLVATLAATVALVRLAASLVQRYQSPLRPRLPELVMLANSLLLFHPYLWIHDRRIRPRSACCSDTSSSTWASCGSCTVASSPARAARCHRSRGSRG